MSNMNIIKPINFTESINFNKIQTRPRANTIYNTLNKPNSNVYGLSMNNWKKYIERYRQIKNKETHLNEAIMNTLFVDLNNKQKYHTLKQKLKKNSMNLTNKPNIKDITNKVKRLSKKIEEKREENAAKTKRNRNKNKQQSYLAGKISTELAPPVITKLNNYARNGKIYNSLMQNIGKITPNIDELCRYIKHYSNEIQLTFIEGFRRRELHEYAGKIDKLWKNVIEMNKLYFDKKIEKDKLIEVLNSFLTKINDYKDKFNCKGGDEKARKDICKKFDVCINAITEIIKLH